MIDVCRKTMFSCCLANIGPIIQLMVALSDVQMLQIILLALKSLGMMKG